MAADDDHGAPSSRPESQVSQSADDDDATSFHDVDNGDEPTTAQPTDPELSPADAEVETASATATSEPKVDAATSSAVQTSVPPHLTTPATAMSSTSSLNLVHDPSLQVDPPAATADELVAFLRGQITDLTSQVTSLNGKLVKSYTTRGDLEDHLHDTQETEKQLRKRVADLERDKERWTKEIEAGGWVERDHVQGEMQRLMTKVVEETQNRQTAVQAHSALENEVENLTSNLFAEANKMVAFERLARARAEDKTRSVEEAGTSMQALLEDVQVGLRDTVGKLEKREAQVAALKKRLAAHGEVVPEDPTERPDGLEDGDLGGSIIFSDGQHLDVASTVTLARDLSQAPIPSQFASPRLLTSALPYQEFLTFITYLRQLRVTTLARPPETPSAFGHSALSTRGFSSDPPPTSSLSPAQLLAPHLLLSTHLSQPFLKRCVEEDSDPVLRLDLAPGLGFLSRRNVANAVVDGTLLIEPLTSGQDLPGDKCALCGCGLDKWYASSGVMARSKSTNSTSTASTATDNLNSTVKKMLGGRGWGFARSNSSNTTPTISTTSPAASASPATSVDNTFSFPSYSPSHHPLDHSLQIHVFKIKDSATSKYPVCPSYCLARLRAVCEFWTYVRVIERGLLLEEGFKFVQGRGETIPVSSSTTSLVKNGSLEDDKKETGHEQENHGLGIEARDFEAADTEIEGTPRIVEPEPHAADHETSDDKTGDIGRADEVKDDQKSKVNEHTPSSSMPTSPAISRPQTPTLTQNANTSSGSVNKPNRPPRSSARASPAIGSAPSPPASPSFPPPPPRRANPTGPSPPPRHPSQPQQQAPGPGAGLTGGEMIANSMGWEDRCWSEVVRLKESVFWARVAAVSSDGGVVSARGAKVWVQ
ncbi:guanine nucleotide exchange factor SEC2 [Sporobolomyces koalae]|uniref:guanine nucleotide exchange factor SEC2 n=1 Tax=Sporobolomyces koalae TaxID=500713 RepID=UPI003180A78D